MTILLQPRFSLLLPECRICHEKRNFRSSGMDYGMAKQLGVVLSSVRFRPLRAHLLP
jgi:hypothetical protein